MLLEKPLKIVGMYERNSTALNGDFLTLKFSF